MAKRPRRPSWRHSLWVARPSSGMLVRSQQIRFLCFAWRRICYRRRPLSQPCSTAARSSPSVGFSSCDRNARRHGGQRAFARLAAGRGHIRTVQSGGASAASIFLSDARRQLRRGAGFRQRQHLFLRLGTAPRRELFRRRSHPQRLHRRWRGGGRCEAAHIRPQAFPVNLVLDGVARPAGLAGLAPDYAGLNQINVPIQTNRVLELGIFLTLKQVDRRVTRFQRQSR